ncbi:MAG TPA: hypothetical protein VG937_02325 [Polyangiaceae bacterium]|nr:hypothetical protein [Polyangiaceae bacterium]
MNKSWPLAMSLTATLSSACTLEADDATLPVAYSESAIGESSCKTAKADFTLRLSRNRTDPALPAVNVASPTTYDHPSCDKAWVIDLVNNPFHEIKSNIPMEVVYNGPRPAGQEDLDKQIVADEATCRTIRMRVVRYENLLSLDRSSAARVIDDVTTSASWIKLPPSVGGLGFCLGPAKIPLKATPPGLGEKLVVQVLKNGNTTVSAKLRARP